MHRATSYGWLVLVVSSTLVSARAEVVTSELASGALEEIVVTARKRAESVQNTPIAIATISGASLEAMQQSSFLTVSARAPSLQYSDAGGEAQLYIRGVGSNLLAIGADPSVAVNLDGVYLARPGMALNQFLDVERIEVLRGPQGTLYGRNATGGAINILSRQPTDHWEGSATAGTGSFNRVDVEAAVGGPVSDVLGVRVAVRREKDDGYVQNLYPGYPDLNNSDITAGRATVRFQPLQAFTANASFDWTEFNSNGQAIRPLDNAGAAQLLGAVPTGSLLTERNNVPSFLDWKTCGPTLRLDWGVAPFATLTSITGYRRFQQDFLFNTDGTEVEVTRTTEHFDTSQVSEELRLTSRNLEHWDWIGGFYYLRENKGYELGLVRANLPKIAADPLGTGVFLIPAVNDGHAYAGFGEVTYKLPHAVRLTAGLRYSQEHKDDFNEQVNVFAGPLNPVAQIFNGLYGNLQLPAASTQRIGERTWGAWTPKFGVDWRPVDSTLLYASYTKGFKSGGFNDNQPTNPVYNPEFVKSYEVGVKNDLLDRRLRLDAALFYYDYSDLQVSSFLNSLTLITNAAQAKIKGLEIEAEGRPAASLDLGLSLTALDAKYSSFLYPYGTCSAFVAADPSCAGVTIGRPRPINASGNYLNNAPPVKATAFGQYDLSLGSAGTVSFYAQASYTAFVYFNAANASVSRQGGYTLFDARLAWRGLEQHIEIAAIVSNLGNKQYSYNIVQFTSTSNPPSLPGPGGVITDPFAVGNALGYPAPGRTWGIEATYRL